MLEDAKRFIVLISCNMKDLIPINKRQEYLWLLFYLYYSMSNLLHIILLKTKPLTANLFLNGFCMAQVCELT